MDPQSAGLLVPKGQYMDPPAKQEERKDPQCHRRKGEKKLSHSSTIETAQEPIGNGR